MINFRNLAMFNSSDADQQESKFGSSIRIGHHEDPHPKGSVADPDPHGTGNFAWIRNYCSGSGSSKKCKSTLHNTIFISHFSPVNSGLCVL